GSRRGRRSPIAGAATQSTSPFRDEGEVRIGVLSDAILPYHHGGKETLQHERAIRLARRGHRVRIHTMHWWPEPEPEIERDGIVLHAIAPTVRTHTAGRRRSTSESV